ncbi:iron transporter [Dendryphion nanum]|uniref:Solute carrier family 40 member n=1 Tax=Dendryphion nanum TaxID=256645 RepID=A0A9P9D9R7_9PLEO|nr:iron transporter [Dendryphion nanum]
MNLYIVQSLTSWSIRMSDYCIAVFLAASFPGTLFYISLYTFVRSFVAVLLSSTIGSLVDRTDRLVALRLAVAGHRFAVALSCMLIYILSIFQNSDATRWLLFTIFILIACVEKLASVANIVIIERDWVIVVSHSLERNRQDVNAVMRRLDLFTKLAAPFLLSFLDSYSRNTAIATIAIMNIGSNFLEGFKIAQLYHQVPALGKRRTDLTSNPPLAYHANSIRRSGISYAIIRFRKSWEKYIRSPVFLPSLSNALLYLTVLSFGSQMVTYLIAAKFTTFQVGSLRMVSVVAELTGTWIAPVVMTHFGALLSGFYFLLWQATSMSAAVMAIATQKSGSWPAAICLVVGVCLKRLGLWGFDLSVQFLVQEGTPPSTRAQFSATEMGCQNVFELLSSTMTIIFDRPDQFHYPIFISCTMIVLSSFCYFVFVRKAKGFVFQFGSLRI